MTNILKKIQLNEEIIYDKIGLDVVLHGQRVADLALQIGKELGLDDKELIELYKAANLHDIGKIYIPDEILYKPGKLTSAEFREMQKHPVYSAQILTNIPSLKQYARVVLLHHENYNGTGYFTVQGDYIPLHSRIITIADCYDAMTSDRPYRSAKTVYETINIMHDEAKYKYDPQVFEAFLRVIRK